MRDYNKRNTRELLSDGIIALINEPAKSTVTGVAWEEMMVGVAYPLDRRVSSPEGGVLDVFADHLGLIL